MATKKTESKAVNPERQEPETTEAKQEESAQKLVSRRRMLGWTAGGALAAVILGQGVSTGRAQARGGLVVEVDANLDTFDSMREPASEGAFPVGPFHILGSIYPEGTLDAEGAPPAGASPIGKYRCWGWIYDGMTGGASVNQVFELDGLGQLNVQGEDMADKAIVGGMGLFKDASGEMLFEGINMDTVAFRATFNLD